MKNVVIFSYASFNWRRYSRPWLCRMTERGGYDFNDNVKMQRKIQNIKIFVNYFNVSS